MTSILHIKYLSVFLIIFLSCSEKGNYTGPYRRKNSTVYYYLNTEANVITETAVRQTFQKWDKATHFNFIFSGRWNAGLVKDGKNTVSFLSRWPSRIPINHIAYCKNWYNDKGEIIESDIIFNMQIAKFTTSRTRRPNAYYVEGVLSHEIGHMIGLKHNASTNSLMKQQISIQESSRIGDIDTHAIADYYKLYSLSSNQNK